MRLLVLFMPFMLVACVSAPPREPAPVDITILFMGNSHTSSHALPDMVAAMVRAARPDQSVRCSEAPGWLFLADRASDPASLNLLRSHHWDFVVLQAQKYSTSGKYTYSTDGAESLIRAARDAHAVPVLFPEWPRQGVAETARIHDLHAAIARRAPACVAPIGQAWDLARASFPDIRLYADDGNHAAPAGAYLTALVLAATLTGVSPDEFNNYLPQFGVPFDVQVRLRSAATRAVLATPPCP